LDNRALTFMGSGKGHQTDPLLKALVAEAVYLHFVLEDVKTVQSSNFKLKIFHPPVLELFYLPTSGTNEVIVMHTQVPVLVKGGLTLELLF
jgi:hypothetical protein